MLTIIDFSECWFLLGSEFYCFYGFFVMVVNLIHMLCV